VRISILPKTSLGRWSVGLAAAIILVAGLLFVLVYPAELELGLGPSSVGLTILAVAYGISGIGAVVTGHISIVKSKEWSILVFLAVVIGLFALIGATCRMFNTGASMQ